MAPRRSCSTASASPSATAPRSPRSICRSSCRTRSPPRRSPNSSAAKIMSDEIGAFVPGQQFRIEGRAGGPLSGLTFAAKDLFDVAGHATGGGNEDWTKTHPVPERHAWAVQTLLDAGATLIGKTITDEVSLGIL